MVTDQTATVSGVDYSDDPDRTVYMIVDQGRIIWSGGTAPEKFTSWADHEYTTFKLVQPAPASEPLPLVKDAVPAALRPRRDWERREKPKHRRRKR